LHRGALRVTATGKNQGNKGKAVLRTVMRESSGNSKQVMGTLNSRESQKGNLEKSKLQTALDPWVKRKTLPGRSK
jgi:hypothetical protein